MNRQGRGPDEDAASDFLTQRQFLISHSDSAFGLASAMAAETAKGWALYLGFFPADRRPIIDPIRVRVLDERGNPAPHLHVRPPTAAVGQNWSREEGSAFALVIEDDEASRHFSSDAAHYSVELLEVEDLDPFFSRVPLQLDSSAGGSPPLPSSESPAAYTAPPEDVDYLAKDYESFRKLILDHMARAVPEWKERNASDLGVTITEVLAYAGDYLSYFQDAVGTEAYLETARRRISVRRHTQLLDYPLSEGCTPRAWLFVKIQEQSDDPSIWLPQGTQFLADSGSATVITYPSLEYDDAIRDGADAFETLYGERLWPVLNELEIYSWRVVDFAIEAGATSAVLVGDLTDRLQAGDVVLFEQIRDALGRGEVDLSKRQVVRLDRDSRLVRDPLDTQRALTEITWFQEDALAFDLPIRHHLTGSEALAVVRGNLVLADFGRTIFERLESVPLNRPYRPRLDLVGERYRLVHHEPFLLDDAILLPASFAARQDEEKVVPALALAQLDESSWVEQGTVIDPIDSRRWSAKRDLVRCDRFSRVFVVETENDGTVTLRFGDDFFGQKPQPGTLFWAFYRVADAKLSSVGPGTGAHLVAVVTEGLDGLSLMPKDLQIRVESVSFPVGAMGGAEPETDEHARLFAPAMVTTQERAVTPEDFIQRALSLDDVLGAWAELTWGGSWTLATLRVQRRGGKPVDASFRTKVAAEFEGRLIMGYQLSVRPPCWVPLDIAMRIRLESHVERHRVERQLERALGTGVLEDGSPAFFNPEAFGFGEDVTLDDLVTAALEVEGILDVEVTRFQPLAAPTGRELQEGQIQIAPHQIAELDSEHGRLELVWIQGP